MNRQQMIEKVERSQIRDIGATPRPGDTVKVHVKVIEGDKRRIQIFQGVIINVRGEGARKTFTVRKVSMGVAVERIFPFYSPSVDKLEVVRTGKVRRAKLFYLRGKTGKAAKVAEGDDVVSAPKAGKAKVAVPVAVAPEPEVAAAE
jgi:large subunit ribosomal protein L19